MLLDSQWNTKNENNSILHKQYSTSQLFVTTWEKWVAARSNQRCILPQIQDWWCESYYRQAKMKEIFADILFEPSTSLIFGLWNCETRFSSVAHELLKI